jgi:ribonuclease I
MTVFDILALAIPALIVLLGGYLVFQARRSRESELNYNLRKTRTALEDTEKALENTVAYYKAEIHRLKTRLGEPVSDEPPSNGLASGDSVNGGNTYGLPPDMKFKQARTAFARLYHPDRHHGDADEKKLRAELFKEFWDELERIDRRYP